MTRLGLNLVSVVAGCLCATGAQAGDWREIHRDRGAAVAIDGSTMRRIGSQLSITMTVAMMPESHLSFYGIMRVDIDCEQTLVAVKGAQYYLNNGDPFGEKTENFPNNNFTGDDDILRFCRGELPSGPGADSALNFFRSVNATE